MIDRDEIGWAEDRISEREMSEEVKEEEKGMDEIASSVSCGEVEQ